MASCAEARSGLECSTSRTGSLPLSRGGMGLRKCASSPMLCSGGAGAEGALEVYVAIRPFQEFGGGLFRKLPRPLRNGVRDAGICHFLTVFRTRDGTLHQFDFGPQGGDIHVGSGPLAGLLGKDHSVPTVEGAASAGGCSSSTTSTAVNSAGVTGPRGMRGGFAAGLRGLGMGLGRSGSRKRSVPGEVRELRLAALPPSHMFVGTTPLSLADIRAFNSLHQARTYELHVNDCRHYVNALVKYSTGFDAAASKMLVHQWQRARSAGRYRPLADRVIRLGHLLTDVANWGTVKAIGHAGMAAILALGTNQAFRLRPAAPLAQGMRTRLAPAGARVLAPMRQALVRKPVVTVGTAAVATYAASGPPALRETASVGARVANGVRSAVAAAASVAQAVSQCTAATTTQATQQVVAMAAGAARGAARLVARPPVGAAGVGTGVSGPAAAARLPSPGLGSPMRITLPSVAGGANRAQRLALAVTSAARR